jgi:hypothetical protein
MSEETGGLEWSESATAFEVRAMIEDWEKEETRGDLLLYAVQAMITEEFLNTISPRSCKLLRQFLIVKDVQIDVRPGYPHYRALLDLLRMNTTLEDPSVSNSNEANNAEADARQSKDATSSRPSDEATKVTAWTSEPNYEMSAMVGPALQSRSHRRSRKSLQRHHPMRKLKSLLQSPVT